MTVLLVLAFLGFALFLALRLRPTQWGSAQLPIRPILAGGPTRRLARPSVERPTPQPGTDWLFLMTSTPNSQLDLSGHGHAPGCTPGHAGPSSFDASNCGHSAGSHGH